MHAQGLKKLHEAFIKKIDKLALGLIQHAARSADPVPVDASFSSPKSQPRRCAYGPHSHSSH